MEEQNKFLNDEIKTQKNREREIQSLQMDMLHEKQKLLDKVGDMSIEYESKLKNKELELIKEKEELKESQKQCQEKQQEIDSLNAKISEEQSLNEENKKEMSIKYEKQYNELLNEKENEQKL